VTAGPSAGLGFTPAVARAYSVTGAAWQAGPGRIYDRLAEEVVGRLPGGVVGRRMLDVGSGTGAASRAAVTAGATLVVATDVALGMLRDDAAVRPPAALADAVSLPFRDSTFDAVVAAFTLNHLTDPAAGLTEVARVLATGGGLAVSAYAADDTHPVKAAVDAACADRGWVPEPWYRAMQAEAAPKLATTARALAAASEAGLAGATAVNLRVPFPSLRPGEMVAWRLGMAQVAGFLGGLTSGELADLATDAERRLGPDPPVVERSLIVLAWRKP
jgi:SAM-dependent methyltransferase